MTTPWLWVVFTLVAAFAQTVRNLLQRQLTATLGTAGATHVRFLYGLPFALVFLVIVVVATGQPIPVPGADALGWTALGALTQIGATAMLLMAMQGRSFVIVTAYIKTEPVQVALFATLLLGEHLTPVTTAAIVLATLGVVLMSWPKQSATELSWRPTLLGLAAAALFGLSAVGFRGAILALEGQSYVLNATTILAFSLLLQTLLLSAYLMLTAPAVIPALLRSWRASLPAGFMGAFASQAWFLAFALESAARVRTLALVEILFAQALAHRLFRQDTSAREWLGIGLVVGGVAWLLNG